MKRKKKIGVALLCMLAWMMIFPLQTSAAAKPSIKLNKTALTIKVSHTTTLKATVKGKNTSVTWKSSDTSVATVNNKGKVTPKKAGKVTITAKANGKTAKCKVKVKEVDYKSLYKKFLAKKQVSAGNAKITPTYFYLLNIDKSGVPELIVTEEPKSYCQYHVYTIRNSKVAYMGYCPAKGVIDTPILCYSSKYKGILAEGWTNFVGGTWSKYYGISGTKLVEKQGCRAWTNPEEYAINQTGKGETVVLKETYSNFFKTYFEDGKIKNYTMRKNTATNRKKYVK